METVKKIFDLLHEMQEGIYNQLHVIDLESNYDYESQLFTLIIYRVYHADGFCFQVYRQKIELGEDEQCELIDDYYYDFDSTMFEGFTEITKLQALNLIIENGTDN